MFEVVLSDSNNDLEFEFADDECIVMMGLLQNALTHKREVCYATIIYVEEREDTCLNSMKSDT